MATKTELETLITTKLADDSNIIAEEHRAVENAIVGEMFNVPIIENTSGTLSITSQVNSDITYNVAFIKQGNKVTCYGTFKNIGATILSDVSFLTVTDLTLNPTSLTPTGFLASSTSSTILCKLVFGLGSEPGLDDYPTEFKAVGPVAINIDYYFNFTYIISNFNN